MNGFARLIKDGIRKLYGLIAVMVASIWLATITQSVLHPKPERVGRSPVPKTNGLTIVPTEEQQPYFRPNALGTMAFASRQAPPPNQRPSSWVWNNPQGAAVRSAAAPLRLKDI